MTIRYTCGSCGSVLKIKDELAGTPGKCPKCKIAFTVPSAADAEAAVPVATAATAKEEHAAAPADEEFDPVAFLMADGGSRPAAIPDMPPPPTPASKRPGTNEPPPKRPIRLDEDAPSAPRRNAGGPATAAETADAMLRTNASSNAKELLTRTMEESRVRAAQMPDEDRGRPGIDYKELWREVGVKLLPGVIGTIVLILLALKIGLYMAGGGRPLPELARVSGTVTKAGKPLAGAEVVFTPRDTREKSSYAFTDNAGEYSLIYDEDANGAVVGKHRVEVSLFDDHGRNLVDGKFSPSSPGLFEVKSGSNELNIEIP